MYYSEIGCVGMARPLQKDSGYNTTGTIYLGMASQFPKILRPEVFQPFFQSIRLFRDILHAGLHTPSTFYHVERDINGSLDTQGYGNCITWAGINVKLFALQ